MDFWVQFWSTLCGALAGALVGGGVAALIAWRTFKSERQARAEERRQDRADAIADRRHRRYEAVQLLLTRMYQVVSTSDKVREARAVDAEFKLAVDELASDQSEQDRGRFQYWAMMIARIFIGAVEWDAPKWRDRTDTFGPRLWAAQGQLRAWYRGEETTECLLLEEAEACEKFLPKWTMETLRE